MKKINMSCLFLRLGPELILSVIMLFGLVHAQTNETEANLDLMINKWQSSIAISRPKYEEMTIMLQEMQEAFPDVVEIYSIGLSVENRELWAIKMSIDVGKERELMKPMVKHVANMHGNEALGRSLILLFAVDLLRHYKEDKSLARSINYRTRAVRILKTMELHLVPSVNPDGYEVASNDECGESKSDPMYKMGGKGRRNKNNRDINRDFPDMFYVDKDNYEELFSSSRQPETLNIMNWIVSHPFVLSTNMHGGALVASYGYDSVPKQIKEISSYQSSGIHSIAPDNFLFGDLAFLYSDAHRRMRAQDDNITCKNSSIPFENGITNGAFWYDVRGGMQDFNYEMSNCVDVTIELSCCKFPPDSTLEQEWKDNKESLYKYTETVLKWGFKGVVKDAKGKGVHAAKVYVEGNSKPVLTTSRGEYWRMLSIGYNYTAYAELQGCESEKTYIELTVPTDMAIVNFTLPNDCFPSNNAAPQLLVKLKHFSLFLSLAYLLPSLLFYTKNLFV